MREPDEKVSGLKSGAVSLMKKRNVGLWMPGRQGMTTKKAR